MSGESLDMAEAKDYTAFLQTVKNRIAEARNRAVLSVNRELISLYWDIGRLLVEKQEKEGWGRSIVENLSADIRKEFPDVKGFSPSNMWRMRAFYLAYSEGTEKLAQGVREPDGEIARAVREIESGNMLDILGRLPWGHNVVLVEKVKDMRERFWYAQEAITNGWSRAVLTHQIESELYQRQKGALKTTNFSETLPSPYSEMMEQAIKDPYIFDFINLGEDAKEKDLEKALLDKIRDFLLELGTGFAFMGSQYHIEVGGQDYYIDLLFYHHRLRCLVAIDLKMGEFKPEYAGKMNFYLSALDDIVRHPDDMPSVGIILCKSKNRIIAEYSLRNLERPVGVAEYRLTPELPKSFEGKLPSPEQLAGILEQEDEERKKADEKLKSVLKDTGGSI